MGNSTVDTSVLSEDPRFDIFLGILEDQQTGHGNVPIPGILFRKNPKQYKKVMGPADWLTFEMCVGSPKHYWWKHVTARVEAHRSGILNPEVSLPILPKRTYVLDFDESKREDKRSIEEILALLPFPYLCAVPTKTAGNWQVWIGFSTPVWGGDLDRFKSVVTSLGADLGHIPGTLEYNPIAATFRPHPVTGEVTRWNPQMASAGLVPVFDLGEFLRAESITTTTSRPVSDGQTVNDLTGKRFTIEQLKALMRQVQVGERHQYLYRYMFARVCEEQHFVERVLTLEEIRAIGHETDEIFPVPTTDDDIEGMVAYFTRTDQRGRQRDPLGKQVFLSRRAADQRTHKATDRYFTFVDVRTELRAHYCPEKLDEAEVEDYVAFHEVHPDQGEVVLSGFATWSRVPEYSGQLGTIAHVAHVLGESKRSVKNCLCHGRRVGHARQILHEAAVTLKTGVSGPAKKIRLKIQKIIGALAPTAVPLGDTSPGGGVLTPRLRAAREDGYEDDDSSRVGLVIPGQIEPNDDDWYEDDDQADPYRPEGWAEFEDRRLGHGHEGHPRRVQPGPERDVSQRYRNRPRPRVRVPVEVSEDELAPLELKAHRMLDDLEHEVSWPPLPQQLGKHGV